MELIFGNCLEILNNIPDKSVDMVFADLPYGITQNEWDKPIPLNDYIEYEGYLYSKADYMVNAYKNDTSYKDALAYYNAII